MIVATILRGAADFVCRSHAAAVPDRQIIWGEGYLSTLKGACPSSQNPARSIPHENPARCATHGPSGKERPRLACVFTAFDHVSQARGEDPFCYVSLPQSSCIEYCHTRWGVCVLRILRAAPHTRVDQHRLRARRLVPRFFGLRYHRHAVR